MEFFPDRKRRRLRSRPTLTHLSHPFFTLPADATSLSGKTSAASRKLSIRMTAAFFIPCLFFVFCFLLTTQPERVSGAAFIHLICVFFFPLPFTAQSQHVTIAGSCASYCRARLPTTPPFTVGQYLLLTIIAAAAVLLAATASATPQCAALQTMSLSEVAPQPFLKRPARLLKHLL